MPPDVFDTFDTSALPLVDTVLPTVDILARTALVCSIICRWFIVPAESLKLEPCFRSGCTRFAIRSAGRDVVACDATRGSCCNERELYTELPPEPLLWSEYSASLITVSRLPVESSRGCLGLANVGLYAGLGIFDVLRLSLVRADVVGLDSMGERFMGLASTCRDNSGSAGKETLL